MTVEIRKLMRKNDDGSDEQYYPETHANAVIGLNEAIGLDKEGNSLGVVSINGKTGIIVLQANDLGIVRASADSDGLLSKELFRKIKEFDSSNPHSQGTVKTEHVEDDIYSLLEGGSIFYPQTRPEAIENFETWLSEKGLKGTPGDKGDPGDPGPPGTAENLQNATAEADGLMSKEDKSKLDALQSIKFEKVGEV